MKAPIAAAALALCLSMGAAHAGTQCVLNKAGYTAEVHWYLPSDIQVSQDGANPKKAQVLLRSGANPAVTKTLTSGKESCETHDKDLFATIRVVGGKDARLATQISAGLLIAAGGVAVCGVSGGSACAPAMELVVDLEPSTALIPKAAGYFYWGFPQDIGKSEHRLILEGSVWDPSATWKKK